MFCTNCGEQMREIDKFCANCGTPAAPRPAKARAASFSPAQAAAAPQAPRNQPASPMRAAAPPPLSGQQEQQVLLEAAEIASVRGMAPVEALPEDFVATPAPPTRRAAGSQTCVSCGEPNPPGNRFCERCGRPLQAEPMVQSAPAPVQARAEAPPPVAQSAWLDVPEPARPAVGAQVKAPAVAKAAAPPAPPVATAAGKSEDFFYFYDDKSSQRGNRKLLIVLMVVLALGVLGVIYLLSRPSAKSAPPANLAITIAPTETEISVGESHDFTATVTGSGDTDVTWSVAEGSAGGTVVNHGAQAQGGAVASLGVYAAPTTPGTYHVVATSKADPAKSATAEVLVSGK